MCPRPPDAPDATNTHLFSLHRAYPPCGTRLSSSAPPPTKNFVIFVASFTPQCPALACTAALPRRAGPDSTVEQTLPFLFIRSCTLAPREIRFGMSSERLIAPAGMLQSLTTGERPDDTTDSMNRKPCEADKFYTYLGTCTVAQLRARLRKLGKPQKGDKGMLFLRSFMKVTKEVGDGGDWARMGGAEYADWLQSPEGQLESWKHPP
jgi:hypothetical protein